MSLSRRYTLVHENGGVPFQAGQGILIRPVQPAWPLVRRKLHIAANGDDAVAAVEAAIAILGR